MPAVRLVLNKTFLASLPSNPAVSCRSVNTWVNILAVLFPSAADVFRSAWNASSNLLTKGQGHFDFRAITSSSGWCLRSANRDFCYFKIKNPLRPEDEAIRWQITVQPFVHSNPAWSALHVPHWSPNCSSLHHQLFAFFFCQLNIIFEFMLLLLLWKNPGTKWEIVVMISGTVMTCCI